ncbi:MAG TPA: glycine cleavage system aminomethyltransferase GcvT [Acidimicrobiia bacterium]|nr:glycine cleavage system aminomethyltransferase GcvT [Acidimicrobiia bacterium]
MPRSPLHAVHESLGARFVDFSGWDMPVQYEGVLAEHAAVRSNVGVFDVSHLGRFDLSGPGSTELLQRLLCNDISKVPPGRAQYTMALNEGGGVEDDIIVWRWDDEHYWVIPNGANQAPILGRFSAAAPHGAAITSLQESTALLAVQGPNALDLIESVIGVRPGRFRVVTGSFEGKPAWAAGTGYTGEPGGEIAVDRDQGESLFREFLAAGAKACGLGARDTLRLEMGYPLWGQDLDRETSPLEADLGWVVDWEHDFVGRQSLAVIKDELPKLLVGFAMEGRQIPRHGYSARAGKSTGTVASGNFSPSLGYGIGMAFLSPPPADHVPLEIEIRGKWHPARRVEPPFLGKE